MKVRRLIDIQLIKTQSIYCSTLLCLFSFNPAFPTPYAISTSISMVSIGVLGGHVNPILALDVSARRAFCLGGVFRVRVFALADLWSREVG